MLRASASAVRSSRSVVSMTSVARRVIDAIRVRASSSQA